MRILAFPGRLNSKAKAPVQDWSTQEIADFYRAHRLLAENGAGIGIDRGVSDEGEPWMVFFDIVSQDVFLHIARIDGTCQLICEPFNMRLDAADIPSLIAQFEHAVRDYLAIRSERAKNVVIHPAARIIMSISAVFLLFKLENGEAYAKGLSDKAPTPVAERAAEKSLTPLARAQAAFQRAFDAFEPSHAAMIAGLILASELVVLSLRAAEPHDAELSQLTALALTNLGTHDKADATALDAAVAATAVHHAPEAVAADIPLANLVVAIPEMVDAPAPVQFTPPDAVLHLAAFAPPPAAEQTPAPAVVVTAPVQPVPQLVANTIDLDTLKTLQDLFLAHGVNLTPVVEGPAPVPERIIDISLARVTEMSQEFAFFCETNFDVAKLFALIAHYAEHMGGADFEYDSNGLVLIEQAGAESLDESQLGMITNHGTDGATYTIVGRADLIDDVLTFFA